MSTSKAEEVYYLFWNAVCVSKYSNNLDDLVDMVRPLVNMKNSDPDFFTDLDYELSEYFDDGEVGSMLADFIDKTIYCFETDDLLGISEWLCTADEWMIENNLLSFKGDE